MDCIRLNFMQIALVSKEWNKNLKPDKKYNYITFIIQNIQLWINPYDKVMWEY